MIDFLIFLHLFIELLVYEPVYTIGFSLGALLFLKWIFYAPDLEDDEGIVNIKQCRNIQVKTLKSPTIDVNREYKYAQTTPSELIQREKLKILDDKILYSKRKIDIMKENGVIGAIIDNIAGNSIVDEQAKIVELEKQKNSITKSTLVL